LTTQTFGGSTLLFGRASFNIADPAVTIVIHLARLASLGLICER
jgi:hypothetical protein